jgi:putative solute:sodium symporter small subunit
LKPDANAYWRETRRLTMILLVVWLLVTFVMNWFARELNEFSFLDFPLGFYMGAQGSLVFYLLIIWFYNRQMRKLDTKYGVDDE